MNPKTHSDIINLWPSIEEFAADIKVKFPTANAWYYRNVIPVRHWKKVIKAGKKRGIVLTSEILLDASL